MAHPSYLQDEKEEREYSRGSPLSHAAKSNLKAIRLIRITQFQYDYHNWMFSTN